MIIVLVVIAGILQLKLESSTAELTVSEQIYAILFLTIVFLWLVKHLHLKDLMSIFMQDRLCFFLSLFVLYIFVIIPLVGITQGVSPISAFRGIWRLANLFLIFVILTEVKNEKQLFILFLFFIFLITAQSGYDLFKSLINVPKELFLQHLARHRLQTLEMASELFLVGPGLLLGLMVILGNRIASWSIFTFCLAINLYRSFFCFSRAILVIFILMLMLFFFLNTKFGLVGRKRGGWIKGVGIIALSAVLLTSLGNYFSQGVDVYRQRFAAMDKGVVKRGDEYKAALNAFRESPILGKGSGYELKFYRSYTGYEEYKHVHNFLLWYLFIGGLPALGLILTILYHYYRKAFGLLRHFKEHKVPYGIVLGGILGVTNLLMLGLVETTMQRHDTNYILAILIGMTLVLDRLKHQFKESKVTV